MPTRRVAIVYKYLPLYRASFFKRLSELCQEAGIELNILYGNPDRLDALKNNATEFAGSNGIYVPNRFIRIGKAELIWQPVLGLIRDADLVIVEQANRLLMNYLLIVRQLLGVQNFAFWGHGKNLQARDPRSFTEKLKRRFVRMPHWWFAYTEGTARYLREVGFPDERITVVNNAIDTKTLSTARTTLSQAEVLQARCSIGILTDNVCIYVGSMYPDKRIGFLLDACRRIRNTIPDFRMIFIGAGTDDYLVRDFCNERPWAIHLGSVYGPDKVKYFMMSKLFLMPGLVGLAVLDSFAVGVPLITTDFKFHSPEIEYLENGHNGLIIAPGDNVELYAAAVTDLLLHERKRRDLAENCLRSAARYTTDKMARRFLEGMKKALETP
jgi:glycosyltransferase involved in cell wall biosynthesis